MSSANPVEMFWRKYLAGFSIPTPLVVEDLRGACLKDDDRYGERAMQLDPGLTAAGARFLQALGVHADILCQAVWALLLARYNGTDEVIFGFFRTAPVADLSGAIPIRVRVAPDASARELLSDIQSINAAIGSHGGVSLTELRRWRDVSAPLPLFESAVVAAKPLSSADVPGISAALRVAGCRFAIHLDPVERGALAAYYDPRRFDADTVDRLLGHVQALLHEIINKPDIAVSLLPILTEGERRQILIDWNDTAAAYPQDACLHQLFEAHARRQPQAVAIYYKDERITYAELESRANRLARHLQSQGVGPEVMVGISVERSPEMVVGMLGILKAGGAYVPVDPHYPKDRIAFMFADTHVPLLLTQRSLLAELPDLDATKICLDADWPAIAQQSAAPVTSAVNPENLAYVIFTSGSTGQPKGIALRHAGVVNNLADLNASFKIGSGDRVMAISALSFDMTVYEVLGTLAAGAAIVIPEAAQQKDPAHWADLIGRHRVTVWNSAPALLEMLVDYAEAHAERHPRSLKVAILGGDWVPVTLPDRLKRLAPDVQVVVLGGATELSIHSTVYYVDQVDPSWKSIPYGRPMANQKAYILDAHLQPVPIGVPGELHLGGVGLARGYFERPELTAAKFIPHPFSGDAGERIYKTGDVARWLPDGNIELLGRMDHQVKIRGHRIELGEISAVLREHPEVQDAVVVMREDQPGNKRLAAYVVPGRARQANSDAGEGATQIAQWEAIYNETYSQPAARSDPKQNFVGWNSSYTGMPFAEPELREMVDRTVERILALEPENVLEIGCGTGLILFRVAPQVRRYDASDLSPVAVRELNQRLREHDFGAGVSVRQRRADDFDGVPDAAYDTVILNSVAQHFPSVDYLLRVIEGAVKKVKPGGAIFIGDIRSLPLLEAFNTSIELYRSPSSLSVAQLRQRINRRMKQEKELNVDPDFFPALQHRLPDIARVAVRPKRGVHQNEFNKFHYDAILYLGPRPAVTAHVPWERWNPHAANPAAVRERLASAQPVALGYTNVPSAGLQKDVLAVRLLQSYDGADTVGALRKTLDEMSAGGLAPEAFWSLGDTLPYRVEISYSGGSDGCYDLLFLRRDAVPADTVPAFPCETAARRPWQDYTNRPVQQGGTAQLVRQLRALLRERLPDYMVPQDVVGLDALPLTPNGKVDRRSLPVPDQARPELEAGYVAPRDAVEEVLAGIWREVLGLDRVGVNDNFFELGGHSLKATQIAARAADAFRLRISLQTLFDNPTVAQLARALERAGEDARTDVVGIAQVVAELNRLSEAEVDALLAARGNG